MLMTFTFQNICSVHVIMISREPEKNNIETMDLDDIFSHLANVNNAFVTLLFHCLYESAA